jgi:hypothetical protein
MTNAIKVLLQMTSVSLQPVPSLDTYKITLKNYIGNYRNKFDCCKAIIIEYYVIINYF